MDFFKNLFGDDDDVSPTITYKKNVAPPKKNVVPQPKKISKARGRGRGTEPMDTTEPNVSGREPRQLKKGGVLGDMSAMDLYNREQKLREELQKDPNNDNIKQQIRDIDDKQDDLVNDLVDELNKGRSIDYNSLNKEQKEKLQNKLREQRRPAKQTDFQSGTMKGDLPTDISPIDQPIESEDLGDENLERREIRKPAEAVHEKDIVKYDAEENTHNDNAVDLSTEFADPQQNTALLDNTLVENMLQSYFFLIVDKLLELSLDTKINSKDVYDKYLKPFAFNNKDPVDFLKGIRDSNRKGLLIENKKKHMVLRGKQILPILIIIVYLFMCENEETFKYNITDFFDFMIKRFLRIFIDDKDVIEYCISIIRSIPIELKTAYKKQLGEDRNNVSLEEKREIDNFVEKIYSEYFIRFGDDLETDLYNFEGKKSLFFHNFLKTLSESNTLFTISAGFSNIGNVIKEAQSNPYVIVQLFSLFLENTSSEDGFLNEAILSEGIIDKIILYKSDYLGKNERNEEVNILRNMTEDERGTDKMDFIKGYKNVGLYKYNNRYYVSFRGTNLKDMDDIKRNVLAYGGKNLYDDPKYNSEVLEGIELTRIAIKKSREEDLDDPKIIAYSGGAVSASVLALRFRDVETDFYNPMFSRNKMTDKIMKRLQKSNVFINYVEGDPISFNVPFYSKKYGIPSKMYSKNKFFNPHDLKQFL